MKLTVKTGGRSVAGWVLICGLVSLQGVARAQGEAPDPADFFEKRVRPILADNCFACHTSLRMGGLEMKSREALLTGGKRGPAVVAGHPEESLLIQAIGYQNPLLKMPPNAKLKNADIEALAAWIKAGVVWPAAKGTAPESTPTSSATPNNSGDYTIKPEQRAFWSYQPVRKPAIPAVKDMSWPKNEIDRFILAKLEAQDLKPVRAAERRTLIRRATFDLLGLPPTPEEVEAFVNDASADAFGRVVDRLLASPHYGERWGRYWLDIARYADSRGGFFEDPYPNAWRYRDWVVQAFNQDLPYNTFIKAQIAADLLPGDHKALLPALGFQALGNVGFGSDDRVDVLTRGVMGFTVACAQCHNHKYDPIPTKDYYSLLGVFRGTQIKPIPLAPESEVSAYDQHKKKIDATEAVIRDFEERQNGMLTDILMKQTSRYIVASWKVMGGAKAEDAARADGLVSETLTKWIAYLKGQGKEQQYLKGWNELLARHPALSEVKTAADDFQKVVLAVNIEKKAIDDHNYIKLGGAAGVNDDKKRRNTELEFIDGNKGRLWTELAGPPYMNVGDGIVYPPGVLYYGPARMGTDEADKVRQQDLAAKGIKEDRSHPPIERFLSGVWKDQIKGLYAELDALNKTLPPIYPFLHAVGEGEKPANIRVEIRGEANNLGDEAPRRFVQILCPVECKPFTQGSGRLELAEALTDPSNPLTVRTIVNRIWAGHFGDGIVRTLSNFGMLGERPTHPELLDYLATRFLENNWSIKQLHREIMLSSTYALSTDRPAVNDEKDADNRLHWRSNVVKRLDVEAMRDTLLAVSGKLDPTVGGPALSLEDGNNHRRTIYGYINRRRLDGTLSLFDFPDPNSTAEGRFNTAGPLQRLYFMNNDFVASSAAAIVKRMDAVNGNEAKIKRAYNLLFSRMPNDKELQLGLQYVRTGSNTWPEYVQVLLTSAEFVSVN